MRLDLVELKKLAFEVIAQIKKPKNAALVVGGLGASYFFYITLKQYLLRRKYRHIPGPPTHGYNLKIP